jgi:hypothetical protein
MGEIDIPLKCAVHGWVREDCDERCLNRAVATGPLDWPCCRDNESAEE